MCLITILSVFCKIINEKEMKKNEHVFACLKEREGGGIEKERKGNGCREIERERNGEREGMCERKGV